MAKIVLGLDIGGANLKAATSAGRALSVPFAVWKQPEKLSAELRKLIAQFPEAEQIAATMTAELCDCYETKREGVRRIIEDLKAAAKGLPIRIWSTECEFVSPKDAIANHMKVAAANWHALGTFAARFVKGKAILIDIGTTTTDLIPIRNGLVCAIGMTDYDRFKNNELVYTGWKRSPAMSLLGPHMAAAEFFATTYDAHLVLGHIKPDATDTDTADGRPASISFAGARLARMYGHDAETCSAVQIRRIASDIFWIQRFFISSALMSLQDRNGCEFKAKTTAIISGSGAFLAKLAIRTRLKNKLRISPFEKVISLESHIGSHAAIAAPAYAVAILAAERRP